jgi:hypothetical protein
MAKFFLSHSAEDHDAVHELVSHMEMTFGEGCVWFDDLLVPPAPYRIEIERNIQQCQLFIFLYSENSATSSHCQDELRLAQRWNKHVMTVSLKTLHGFPGNMPNDLYSFLHPNQCVDLSRGANDARSLAKLWRAIRLWQSEHAHDAICVIRSLEDYRITRTKVIKDATESLLIQIRVARTFEDTEALCNAIENKRINVRLLICDPSDSPTRDLLLDRGYGELDSYERIKRNINDFIDDLVSAEKRAKNGARFEYVEIPYPPSNVAYIADQGTGNGVALTALTSFRTENYWETPSTLIRQVPHADLYKFYVEQFEKLWAFGKEHKKHQ